MSTDIPKQYEPKDVQSRWYSVWDERGDFHADPHAEKKSHTIMIPLPNVTGALHMGHALNGTLQDLITRWRRMQGCEALWMPGTDHAGIATQAVVERRMLEEEGLTRHDVGRDALVNRIWKWKDAYEDRILNQLKQLGASCDWRRTRFTLDDVCSRAVRRTFFKLFRDGLIYRGKRLVNWDPFLQTAVADDEVFHDEVDGHFWTFTYPVVGSGEKIAFSTTRPETMLGDTAVCVHPSDERYKHLLGKKVLIPLVGREIPIIADALLAKMDMGTGAVKVTPAHDANDYACGLRNDLEMINILNPDGTLNRHAGDYAEMKVGEARAKVVEDMQQLGHFVAVEERKIELAHSDRSKTPIEPYLSDQWFVKMGDHEGGRPGLAQLAMDAVSDRRVRFFPSRYAKTYLDWLGEKRDWCISRQLWWGHRIPIWSRTFSNRQDAEFAKDLIERQDWYDSDYIFIRVEDLNGPGVDTIRDTRATVAKPRASVLIAVDYGHEDVEQLLESRRFAGFVQEEDVLDTWFSSALWPHSTLGWPDTQHDPPLDESGIEENAAKNQGADAPRSPSDSRLSTLDSQPSTNAVLDYFYPGSVLITSRDIITLWVARMVLTGLYNMGDVPFGHVCVHPKILDGFGQTMSKSKGNGVDPVDLIDKYGTDAVRFTIASFAGETQDVRLPVGYECPHCGAMIPQKLFPTATITYVVPETLQGDFPLSADGKKPELRCAKCKKPSQFSSPAYEPDADAPVARIVSERFEYGRNFCNKLWNASRFAMLNLEGYTPGPVADKELMMEDRWVLSRLATVVAEVTTLLGRYQFDAATRAIREFTWNEFCDWYLEMIKPRLRDEAHKPIAQRVLVGVLDRLLRLLSPLVPFVTEELWQRLGSIAPERGLPEPSAVAQSVTRAAWPKADAHWQDRSLESRFEKLQETIVAVRNVRAVYGIPPTTPLKLHMRCSDSVAGEMQDVAGQFDNLAKTVLEAAGVDVERPRGAAGFTLDEADGFIPLEGVIDREAELARQQKEAEKLRGFITGQEKKLANKNFVERAPAEVVNETREKLVLLGKQLESVERIIGELSGD